MANVKASGTQGIGHRRFGIVAVWGVASSSTDVSQCPNFVVGVDATKVGGGANATSPDLALVWGDGPDGDIKSRPLW